MNPKKFIIKLAAQLEHADYLTERLETKRLEHEELRDKYRRVRDELVKLRAEYELLQRVRKQ